MTKRLMLAFALIVGACASIGAASKLAFDMAAPDAATAQSYVYRYFVDGAQTGTVLSGVSCSGTTTITCSTPFPVIAAGTHTLVLTAATAGGPESPQSAVLSFTVIVTPGNVRVQ